ncbi:MAG TPA: FlgO family outer membrane protein [Blastocatellia bacterium]|nr:FlgO family outer membrane protein [Blastocatellia bacterium]
MAFVPQNILHYRLIKELGKGGMGEVYLAEDMRLDRKVALKLLPPEFASDANRMARFVQEAKSASALNHPGIITIYEIGDAEGLQFIASEYIEGRTLRQEMLRGRMPVREALDVAVQIAGALSAAHGAGIIHRDIKPENVMLRPDGFVKVLDFGLAKPSQQETPSTSTDAPTLARATTEPGVLLGTLAYMSPEQARGKPVDARTDIFSFGVLLYEMVTGRSPFEGETTSDIIASILKTDPPPLVFHSPDAPAELERIITKALAKRQEERYQTTQDLLIDLKRLRQQLEIDGELERSRSGDRLRISGFDSGKVSPATTVDTRAEHTTSSAEYIATGIKQHKRGFLFAAVAIVAISAVIAASILFTGKSGIDSLAVLPFVNAGNDQNADYLSDGISESIIYDLSQVSTLRVIPRSSVFRYKGQQADPQTVARELAVRAVFTGTIRVQGDNLLVSAELIDTKENRLLWGQHYNHRISDILSLQQEISKSISDKLRLNLSGTEEKLLARRHTESGEAYQEYLKGQFWLNRRDEEGFRKAIEFFNQAVEKDPAYALAYAGLADCYALLGTYALLEPNDGFPKAKAAALKALALDQQLAEAHTSLANILTSYEWDFKNAEAEFKKSIALNPNYATAHQWYAEHLQVMGRHDEAIAEIKRAQELDPLSLIIGAVAGRLYYCGRKYDQAIGQLNRTLQMDREFGPASAFISQAYLRKGMNEQAILAAEEPTKSAPGVSVYLTILGNAYAISGKRTEAANVLFRLRELSKQQYVQPSYIAMVYAGLGERDQTFEWLEKAYASRDDRLVFVMTDPLMDGVASDSRFQDLARRIGLPEQR